MSAERPSIDPESDAGRLIPRGRQRYGLLLLSIVVAFLVEGITEPGRWEQLVVTAVLSTTLLLALWAVEAKPVWVRVARGLVAAAVVLALVEAISGRVDDAATRLIAAVLVAVAPPAIMVGVMRGLRITGAVTLEAVVGVLCVYFLIGMFFAFVYGAIDKLGGAPFFAQNAPATAANCNYFSFTTLATLGYGDFTARSNLGHTLSVLEALLGQLYLVTIVALIVSNLGRRGRRAPEQA